MGINLAGLFPGKPQRDGVAISVGNASALPGESTPKAAIVPSTGIASPDMAEDIRLVHRTLGGDQAAFTAIVEKYKDPVYNVAYRMLGNAAEAEDVAQEAFVRAYTQLRTFNDQRRFSTWLLSITSHLAIDQLRRRRFLALPLENVPFLEWIADGTVGPEQAALAGETADEMQHILDTLPLKYRAVLILRYWQDQSYEEIGATLHITPALVKARLHRARELVARTMKSRGLSPTMASEEDDALEVSDAEELLGD